jgi:hypothetical protein
VSLLSPRRALDDIPPRIQRMRIRLMRFDFSVEYLAEKQLCVADTLSRFPLQHEPEIVHSADVIERYVSVVVASLPITDVLIDKVLSASATDDATAREPRGRNTTRYIESLASCCFNKEHDIIVRQAVQAFNTIAKWQRHTLILDINTQRVLNFILSFLTRKTES